MFVKASWLTQWYAGGAVVCWTCSTHGEEARMGKLRGEDLPPTSN